MSTIDSWLGLQQYVVETDSGLDASAWRSLSRLSEAAVLRPGFTCLPPATNTPALTVSSRGGPE